MSGHKIKIVSYIPGGRHLGSEAKHRKLLVAAQKDTTNSEYTHTHSNQHTSASTQLRKKYNVYYVYRYCHANCLMKDKVDSTELVHTFQHHVNEVKSVLSVLPQYKHTQSALRQTHTFNQKSH